MPHGLRKEDKILIKSMTGYGRAVETVNGREFTVELRSVNNRYLDCSVRLPRILTFGEDAVKQAVKNSISRGKVDVFISVRSEGGDEAQVTVNTCLLEGYLDDLEKRGDLEIHPELLPKPTLDTVAHRQARRMAKWM